MTNQIDSEKFFRDLQVIERMIKEIDNGAQLSIFIGFMGAPDIQISKGYSSDAVKVQGKHLGDLMEEFTRRLQFAEKQANLAIGYRVEEGEGVREIEHANVTLPPEDDRIPF